MDYIYKYYSEYIECICIYIYIYVCVYMCIYIYIFFFKEGNSAICHNKVKLTDIKLSKISQSWQAIHMVPHIWIIQSQQSHTDGNGILVARDWDVGGMQWVFNGHKVSVG